jgi:hypothetical protein
MEIVAGLSLKNLQPRVWDRESPDHTRRLAAVMLSFDEFRRRPAMLRQALAKGLFSTLGVPADTSLHIYLDNGAFAYHKRNDEPAIAEYLQFVRAVKPTWYPVPADYIPLPNQSSYHQRRLFERTVAVMEAHSENGFCPVIHPGPWLDRYMDALARLNLTRQVALGGLVPHLLSRPGAQRRGTIVSLGRTCRMFPGRIHAFGIGGVVTLHLAAALGVHSADSSGWRQRAAYGLVLLRGRSERQAVQLGKWRGRALTPDDWQELERCRCPTCRRYGPEGLRAEGLFGFSCRAVHNLTVLLDEGELIRRHQATGDFAVWSLRRIKGNRLANLVRLALEVN